MVRYSIQAVFALILSCGILSCSRPVPAEEQLRVAISTAGEEARVDTTNSVPGNVSLEQMPTSPKRVVLTGLPQHRLVAVYKSTLKKAEVRSSYSSEYWESDEYTHFMPGLDLLFGYNLIKLSHYDMVSEKLNDLFDKPILVKSLYYPSWVQDSIGEKQNRKPITRDYFMVSAYDEDTNADTLINRHDLRRLYHFNAACTQKTMLLPPNYSVVRSQYDRDNDAMFVYAIHDANGNGRTENTEPTHVFWINLKSPAPAKRMY